MNGEMPGSSGAARRMPPGEPRRAAGERIERMAVVAFTGFMCFAVLLMLFAVPFMDYAYKRAFELPNLLLAVLAVAVVTAVLAVVASPVGVFLRCELSRQGRRFDCVIAVATVALFAALIPFARSYALETGWDSGAVTSIAGASRPQEPS